MRDNPAGFTGNVPENYDRHLGPVLFVDYGRDLADRIAALKPGRILETAAGTGIVTKALRDRLPASTHITVTDLNAPMLEVARAKFPAPAQLNFAPADAQALPFADASFDAMICQFGIMFYPDRPKSYREARRVLAPGGQYSFSVWDSHRFNGFARITDGLIRQFFPVDPPSFYAVPFACAALDPIKQDLLDAGFTDIRAEVLTIEKPVADLALFARGLVFGNPLVDQIRARGTVTPEALHAAVVEALGREFGTGPARVPLQTIFWSARRPG